MKNIKNYDIIIWKENNWKLIQIGPLDMSLEININFKGYYIPFSLIYDNNNLYLGLQLQNILQ